MNNKKDELNSGEEIDYGECSAEELLRFLRLRDKEISSYREDLSESSLEKSERIKNLQGENIKLSEKLRGIFDKDVVYAINNIVRDVESGHRVEIAILDDDGNTRAITTIGALVKDRDTDKIWVDYANIDKKENLVIVGGEAKGKHKIPFMGTEQFFYYKDDSYKTVYYGIILLKKKGARNVLIYTVVTDYFLRRRRSMTMIVSNFMGNMGSSNRKVLQDRINKMKNNNSKNKKKVAKK